MYRSLVSQIAGSACLVLIVANLVCFSGCRGTTQKVSQQDDGSSENKESDAQSAAEQQPRTADEQSEPTGQDVLLGDLDKAIARYTEILREPLPNYVERAEVTNRRAETMFLRGEAFLAKGFPLIAIEDFTEALEVGGDDVGAKALVSRAMALAALHRWSQVVADSTRAIRLQPDNGQAFLIRSQALAALGEEGAATTSLQEAERLGIRTTWRVPFLEPQPTVIDQARALLDSGNAPVALEVLEAAILNGEETWESNDLLAKTQFQLKDYYRAVVAATRSLRGNPANAEAYRIRGLSNLQRGNLDQSIFDLQAAIALDESLGESLGLMIAEAHRRGGLEPAVRADAVARIKRSVATDTEGVTQPGKAEQWLLDLFTMTNSSQQIDHFQRLLADNTDSPIDSMNWLADFLMLNRNVPGVEVLRTWLNQQSKGDDASQLASQLWDRVSSRGVASRQGVNLFADLPAYTINYQYYTLLQSCIGGGLCRVKMDHLYQAIDIDSPIGLKLILPHANVLDRQLQGLLQQCMARDRKQHAVLIISRYESGLTWQLLQFLEMPVERQGPKLPPDIVI